MSKLRQFLLSFPKMHLAVIAIISTMITVSFAMSSNQLSDSTSDELKPGLRYALPFTDDDASLLNIAPSAAPQNAPIEQRLLEPLVKSATANSSSDTEVTHEEATPADVPQPLETTALPEQTAAMPTEVVSPAEPELTVTSFTVKSGDTLSTLFERANIPISTMYNILAIEEAKASLLSIYPGEIFNISKDADDQLVKLSYQIDPITTLHIQKTADGFSFHKAQKQLETRRSFKQVTINSSVFVDGSNAGLSDNLIMQLTDIFGWDIDFIFDIRQGDSFSVLYEEDYVDGEKYRDGKILAAEFLNQGESFKAIRFTDSDDITSYFDDKGKSMRKAFLRVPVDVGRVSSGFNLNRRHPILHKIVAHKGTDYAAPRGTPVKTVGNGKIIYAGPRGSYGNVIYIQHGQRYETRYAHLKGFAKGIRTGKSVKQGQIIGYVGTTGRSTGPHLHYEFIVDGVHRNSRTVKLPQALPIPDKDKKRFAALSQDLFKQIDLQKQVLVAQQAPKTVSEATYE